MLENIRYNVVRMIKPNLIFSHDWHVQPYCQRSLRVIRLSGPFWIEAWMLLQVVLELVALAVFALNCVPGVSCATF